MLYYYKSTYCMTHLQQLLDLFLCRKMIFLENTHYYMLLRQIHKLGQNVSYILDTHNTLGHHFQHKMNYYYKSDDYMGHGNLNR